MIYYWWNWQAECIQYAAYEIVKLPISLLLDKSCRWKTPWVSKYCNVTQTLRFHVNDDITDCIIQEYQIRIFRIFQQVTDDTDVTRSHKMIFWNRYPCDVWITLPFEISSNMKYKSWIKSSEIPIIKNRCDN